MDDGSHELPPPPDLHEIRRQIALTGTITEKQIDALLLEMVYEHDGGFIVDWLIAQSLHEIPAMAV